MSAPFVFAQAIDFRFELLVRGDAVGLGQNLTSLDVVTGYTAKQASDVFASTSLFHFLAELLDARYGRLALFLGQADNLNFFADLDQTAFDPAGCHRSATFDTEDVFDSHQERLVFFSGRLWNERIDRIEKIRNAFRSGWVGWFVVSCLGVASYDRGLFAWETVLG
ncbi:MAG: hypothetical protein LW699_14575 [Pirellula sp.]|nr:hypothetical protein [Pirellula sp.]